MIARLALAAALAATAAIGTAEAGDPWFPGKQSMDSYYTADGLSLKLIGNRVLFMDGSQTSFGRDGRVLHQQSETDPGLPGRYIFRPYGMVCITYDRGDSRCDTFVRTVGDMVMLTGNGERRKIKGVVRRAEEN
ncbi:hypothetical protein [Mangrovicoccus algicola]|uniref:Secreted protein n=1 Tax=Mangrovicoccus algicola TaxID=2771008 RepID=A0A8J6Z1Y2_9RHOB|nr:hypothetical protein [Mangrovicoccus algicola]MBE3640116.1 hypothetical protein [Mangrovicoccus algicola]